MHPPAELVAFHRPPRDEPRGEWLGARHYELLHSAKVVGPRLGPPTDARSYDESSPAGEAATDGPSECDYLVSVLREEWEAGGAMARLRLLHTSPELGPLEAVVTGLAVPQFLRVSGGTLTSFRVVRPEAIALELRRAGEARGVKGLLDFRLEPASSYTIGIAGCGFEAPEDIEWSEGQEHAE
jgi:hypothetical protein